MFEYLRKKLSKTGLQDATISIKKEDIFAAEQTEQIGGKKRKLDWKKRTLVILLSVLFVLCSITTGIYLYIRNAMTNPLSQFQATPLPSDAYDGLLSEADPRTFEFKERTDVSAHRRRLRAGARKLGWQKIYPIPACLPIMPT